MPPATASRAGVTPEASRDRSSGTFAKNMSLHPYFPPSLLFYFMVCVAIGFISVVLLSRKFNPFWIYICAATSFLPTILAGIWLFWAFTTFGNSGYVGTRDPQEIFAALYRSFLQGAFSTFVLLTLDGFIVWRAQQTHR